MAAKTFTPEEIIAAFEANPAALSINLDQIRYNKSATCAYIKPLLSVNGQSYALTMKFFKQKTAFRIMAPEDRKYECINCTFTKNDYAGGETAFGKAVDLISTAFAKVMKEYVASHLISDDAGDDDNTSKTKVIPSTKVTVPIKKIRMVDGKREEYPNPLINAPLPLKRYASDAESELEFITGKQFKLKPIDIPVLDLSKVENNRPVKAVVDGEALDTSNVHKFITKGSEISGAIAFDVISSKAGCCLKLAFRHTMYVNPAQGAYAEDVMQDDDFALMGMGTAPVAVAQAGNGVDDDGFDHEEVDPMMANIDSLTL